MEHHGSELAYFGFLGDLLAVQTVGLEGTM
jgi:hypothetical protein